MRRLLAAFALPLLFAAGFVASGLSKPPDFCQRHPSHPSCQTSTPGSSSTTVSSGTVYFDGDFDTCDLSQWSDFHDAQLSVNPPGFVVQPSPAYYGCAARVNVTNAADTSSTGDASFLWTASGYNQPWLAKGADTWFRMQVAFPDGTSFPGKFTHSVVSSGWDTFMEWHSANGCGYSNMVSVWGSDPPVLMFRPVGGAADPNQTFKYIHEKDASGADIPLRFNHWYDIVVHFVFNNDPALGLAEWWVDGALRYSAHISTISTCSDGQVHPLSYQAGLYRGPSRTDQDTIYIDGVRAGSTRISVDD